MEWSGLNQVASMCGHVCALLCLCDSAVDSETNEKYTRIVNGAKKCHGCGRTWDRDEMACE